MAEPLLAVHGITGGVDKVGVCTLEFPTHVLTLGETLQRAASINSQLSAQALAELGLRVVGRRIAQLEGKLGFLVTFAVEGGAFPDDNGKSAKDDPERSTFSISGAMSEDPIQSHPNFEKIASVYGWQDETKEFPLFLPLASKDGSNRNGLIAATGSNKPKVNPLAGVSSYRAVGMVLKITYSAKTMPSDLFDHINEIFDLTNMRLPGGFILPKLGAKRNWLKLIPEVNSRGGVLEIAESYELSGPNGWIKEVYDRDQLSGIRSA